jgi:hypothetical protein
MLLASSTMLSEIQDGRPTRALTISPERYAASLAGKMPAKASNTLAFPYFFASFAQVSLNLTVRFQICLSRVESGSSAK